MTNWIDVAGSDAVAEGDVMGVTAQGKPIALFRVEDTVFALHDRCSHGQARLSDGFVEGDQVECPLHQGLICIRTGAPASAPITTPVASYPVRIVDGRVLVAL